MRSTTAEITTQVQSELHSPACINPFVTCRCGLQIKPMHFKKDINSFLIKYHRHHGIVQGWKYAIGIFCKCRNEIVGVAICSRAAGRKTDCGEVIEVSRVCVMDGVKNGCSKLYGACARIAKEMGYERIQTFILNSEAGKSLLASGWQLEAVDVGGKEWNSSGKMKRTSSTTDLFGTYKKYPSEMKQRWSKQLRSNGR